MLCNNLFVIQKNFKCLFHILSVMTFYTIDINIMSIFISSILNNINFCMISKIMKKIANDKVGDFITNKNSIRKSSSEIKGMNKARFGRYNYPCELESAINCQINLEQHASRVYLAIASYYGQVDVARKGCNNLFMNMYREEVQHACELIEYQLLRGGAVFLDALQPQPVQPLALIKHFESALDLELSVTKKIDELINLAVSYNDHQCADFLTSRYMKEQIESINMLSSLITVLRPLENNEEKLYIFDINLQNQFPCKK